MNRICTLLLLPAAWFALSVVNAADKAVVAKPTVAKPTAVIELTKIDNVDFVSVHTKGTRILARSLTLDGGSTINPISGEIELNYGDSTIRTKKLEMYTKLTIKQIDLIRIEIEPVQN